MHVLALLPVYGSNGPTGAFITTTEYLLGLVGAGHAVSVVTTLREPGTPYIGEGGVPVWPLSHWRRAVAQVRPELIITHHGDRRAARIVQQTGRVPHLLMVHGTSPRRDLGAPSTAWFPSHACERAYPPGAWPSLVLPPPINPTRYQTTPGAMVTLNGSTAAKGADVLAQLADHLPDTAFLMVRAAGHTPQPMPPNVTVTDRMDPRELYARTRVLLMPSTTESYGRAGVEAMVSGIPVIASPLPGIREALGNAAVYLPRDDTDAWTAELRRLTIPAAYAAASAAASRHAGRLISFEGNLAAFEGACRRLARPRPHPRVSAPASARPDPTLRELQER
jgi:glycosyltransferase involved in cell wall biosynthesis